MAARGWWQRLALACLSGARRGGANAFAARRHREARRASRAGAGRRRSRGAHRPRHQGHRRLDAGRVRRSGRREADARRHQGARSADARGQQASAADRGVRRARHRGPPRHVARSTCGPRPPKDDPDDWRIERLEPVSNVSGLYRLALNTQRQFDVRNLTLTGTDVTIEMTAGTAFVAEIPDGPTGIVLLGRGRMRFAPPDEAERTQLRHLRRRRRSRHRIRRRVRAHPAGASSTRSSGPKRWSRAPSSGRPPARPGRLRRVHRPDAAARSHRSEPRSLVAGSVVRRSDRRGAHPPLRRAHLRALGQRGGRHHRLRSPPPPQHLAVRVGSEAGVARALLQRRRSRRLRRPRLRHRRDALARSLLDQRHRARCASGSARGR